MKAIGIIGYSNTGKTTLIEKLIPLFAARGLRVAAIKNAHHGFDMDRPGKDSYRYREAGAAQVLIATSQRWALLTETPHNVFDVADGVADDGAEGYHKPRQHHRIHGRPTPVEHERCGQQR